MKYINNIAQLNMRPPLIRGRQQSRQEYTYSCLQRGTIQCRGTRSKAAVEQLASLAPSLAVSCYRYLPVPFHPAHFMSARARPPECTIRNPHVEEWHIGTVGIDTPTFFEEILDRIDAAQDDEVFSEITVGRNVPYQLGLSKKKKHAWRGQAYRISSSTWRM